MTSEASAASAAHLRQHQGSGPVYNIDVVTGERTLVKEAHQPYASRFGRGKTPLVRLNGKLYTVSAALKAVDIGGAEKDLVIKMLKASGKAHFKGYEIELE